MTRYKGIFASSSDPTGQTLSLTVSSAIQTVIGLIGTLVVIKGVDPMIVSQNAQTVSAAIQNIAAQGLAMATAAYSGYHSLQVIWGIMRKFFPRVPDLPDLGTSQQ